MGGKCSAPQSLALSVHSDPHSSFTQLHHLRWSFCGGHSLQGRRRKPRVRGMEQKRGGRCCMLVFIAPRARYFADTLGCDTIRTGLAAALQRARRCSQRALDAENSLDCSDRAQIQHRASRRFEINCANDATIRVHSSAMSWYICGRVERALGAESRQQLPEPVVAAVRLRHPAVCLNCWPKTGPIARNLLCPKQQPASTPQRIAISHARRLPRPRKSGWLPSFFRKYPLGQSRGSTKFNVACVS